MTGTLTGITDPNGQTVTHAYNAANGLTGVTDWLGNTTAFGYDPNGNFTSAAYVNGTPAAATHNAANQVTAIADTGPGGTSLASFGYTLDANNLWFTVIRRSCGAGQCSTETMRGAARSPKAAGRPAAREGVWIPGLHEAGAPGPISRGEADWEWVRKQVASAASNAPTVRGAVVGRGWCCHASVAARENTKEYGVTVTQRWHFRPSSGGRA